MYPRIRALLSALKARGVYLAVATGKFTAEELQACQPDFFLPDLADIDRFLEIAGA